MSTVTTAQNQIESLLEVARILCPTHPPCVTAATGLAVALIGRTVLRQLRSRELAAKCDESARNSRRELFEQLELLNDTDPEVARSVYRKLPMSLVADRVADEIPRPMRSTRDERLVIASMFAGLFIGDQAKAEEMLRTMEPWLACEVFVELLRLGERFGANASTEKAV